MVRARASALLVLALCLGSALGFKEHEFKVRRAFCAALLDLGPQGNASRA